MRCSYGGISLSCFNVYGHFDPMAADAHNMKSPWITVSQFSNEISAP